MDKPANPNKSKAKDKGQQDNADDAWARNRLQNEIQYLMDQGKSKEAKVLKKQLADLIKSQKNKG
jgi:hypothetical protein